MFNGQSDTLVLEAGATENIDTYIVCPSVVCRLSSMEGLASRRRQWALAIVSSSATPSPSATFLLYQRTSQCHILDPVDFLVKVSGIAAQGPAQGSAYSRYYMLETSRVQWRELAAELAKGHARKENL